MIHPPRKAEAALREGSLTILLLVCFSLRGEAAVAAVAVAAVAVAAAAQ